MNQAIKTEVAGITTSTVNTEEPIRASRKCSISYGAAIRNTDLPQAGTIPERIGAYGRAAVWDI